MVKYAFSLFLCLQVLWSVGQVGINTTDPQAVIDISASDPATPSATDGLLIPRIDEFPLSNPSSDQDSMMVFVTGNGAAARGLYFWDQNNTSWVLLSLENQANFSLVRASLSGNQVLNDTGLQKMNFDNVIYDINNEFDTVNNRFVASESGYYRISASYHTVNAQTNTNYYGIGIYVNGAIGPEKENIYNHSYNASLTASQVVRQVTTLVFLNSNDYVEISATNYQSGSVSLDSFSGKTDVVIERIR